MSPAQVDLSIKMTIWSRRSAQNSFSFRECVNAIEEYRMPINDNYKHHYGLVSDEIGTHVF